MQKKLCESFNPFFKKITFSFFCPCAIYTNITLFYFQKWITKFTSMKSHFNEFLIVQLINFNDKKKNNIHYHFTYLLNYILQQKFKNTKSASFSFHFGTKWAHKILFWYSNWIYLYCYFKVLVLHSMQDTFHSPNISWQSGNPPHPIQVRIHIWNIFYTNYLILSCTSVTPTNKSLMYLPYGNAKCLDVLHVQCDNVITDPKANFHIQL